MITFDKSYTVFKKCSAKDYSVKLYLNSKQLFHEAVLFLNFTYFQKLHLSIFNQLENA